MLKMLATPSRTPEGARPASPKITRGHSCILCQQRKVKCNREHDKPCSNCVKASAECIPSAPTVPRRRKRKMSDQDVAAKLRKYERLLKKNGVKIEEEEEADDTAEGPHEAYVGRSMALAPPKAKRDQGMLFADHENSRYVENTLWENLRDEIQDPKEALQSSSDDESERANLYPDSGMFLLGHNTATKDLAPFHPSPVQIFRLWQTFLVNVNPLVKIFHAPTVQQIVLDSSGDLVHIPKATEALMFAIYLLAVTSLKTEECESMFGETRTSLLSKYSHGTQQALTNAKYLKSLSLYSLQAYSLFLLALRRGYDPHTFWILTGSAVRIAQRLGLHRDSAHQVSLFDAEMRRRTWWQVVFLDGQASKLAGAGFPAWLTKFDTKMPLNISDSDLNPTMKEAPVEKEGVTEMLFCSIRYEVAIAIRKTGRLSGGPGFGEQRNIGQFFQTGPNTLAAKDKAIDELEAKFQDRYVKYCDPSIPLHLLAIYMSKSVICTMRLMAHHPRQYPDKGASMPQKEKDMLFSESLRELGIVQMGYENKLVQCFKWHIHVHFQLDAFIYVLSELRVRTRGEQVETAWQQVEKSFEYRTEMLNDTKNSLYHAIGNLTLKAWAKREEAYQGFTTPRFISVLRSQRNISAPAPVQPSAGYQNEIFRLATIPVPDPNRYDGFDPVNEHWKTMDFGYDMAMADITPTAYDWEYWQTLMDGDLPVFSGDVGPINETWNVQQPQ